MSGRCSACFWYAEATQTRDAASRAHRLFLTAVRAPLLQADGKTLVVQTMPSQLLEQSKSTLRATFSSVLKKRIFTLTYDRSTAMTWHMVQKLRSARRVSGVLLCSASTIKSIQLKFLEALDTLSDQRRGALAMERQTKTLSAVLDLFSSGALVMDEVRR